MSLPRWIVGALLLVGLTACSSNEEEIVQDDQDNVELSEADDELDGSEVVLDEDLIEDSSPVAEGDYDSADDTMIILTEDGQEKVVQNEDPSYLATQGSSFKGSPTSTGGHFNAPVQLDKSKGYANYKVQKGETLMWIAFKIYGDYTKWRHLAHTNAGILKGGHSVSSGTSLKYIPPVQEFDWSPTGNPYLVKKGDTLGTISKDVYGVMSRWKDIFENNRPLIRNPNLIFAGFTIYYKPDGKKLAGEKAP